MARNVSVDDDLPKVKVCSGHSRPVPHIAYSRIIDGSYWFVSSCLDGKPHLRNGESGDWVGTFEGHKGAVWMSCFNNDATQLVTASGDYSAKLWNALEGTDLHTWHQPHCVKCIDWFEGAGGVSRVITGCMDKKVRLYDVNMPSSDPFILEGHTGVVKASFFGRNPDVAFSAGGDNTIRQWDLRSLQCSRVVEVADLNGLEYNSALDVLVCASKHAVIFLSSADLSFRQNFPFLEEVECASLALNGQVFALGSKLKVKEFDYATGTELQAHRGHHGPVFVVKYAPDSNSFSSGSEDGMVRIWPTSSIIKQSKE